MKQLENDCMVSTITTDLAIEAEKDKREVTLPPEYRKYASVFSEEEAQRFPPSQAWDHAIDFNASHGVDRAVDGVRGPLLEDEALDDLIDEQLAKGYI